MNTQQSMDMCRILNKKFFLSRVFLALADDPKDRGIIIAQGGGKVTKQSIHVQPYLQIIVITVLLLI